VKAAALGDVVTFLDTELRTREVPDFDGALNGLQLANAGRVTRVAAAVDFSARAVAAAAASRADLLVVHHGMFWGEPQPITGRRYDCLRAALDAGLAVYSSHLPLDLHPTLGNNALLAAALSLTADRPFGRYRDISVGLSGACDVSTVDLIERLRGVSARHATSLVVTPVEPTRRTRRWAMVTGSGASTATLDEAREVGADTLIVGEGPHHTAVAAMDSDLCVAYAGHYATETFGVEAVARLLGERFGLPWSFLDLPTGL
jgi:dinuclear metal center YbgI/SA1388 family protein